MEERPIVFIRNVKRPLYFRRRDDPRATSTEDVFRPILRFFGPDGGERESAYLRIGDLVIVEIQGQAHQWPIREFDDLSHDPDSILKQEQRGRARAKPQTSGQTNA